MPEPSLPPCAVVEDCPPCQGWNSCQEGLCFDLGMGFSVSVTGNVSGQAAGEFGVGASGLLLATTAGGALTALQLTRGNLQPGPLLAASGALLSTPLATDQGRVLALADDAVWRFDPAGDGLAAHWRWKGAGAAPMALNLTAAGLLVAVRPPGTVLWLRAGAGALAESAWPRHRRTAGATAGLTTQGGR